MDYAPSRVLPKSGQEVTNTTSPWSGEMTTDGGQHGATIDAEYSVAFIDNNETFRWEGRVGCLLIMMLLLLVVIILGLRLVRKVAQNLT